VPFDFSDSGCTIRACFETTIWSDMMDDTTLDRALVFGATRGVGLAVARLLRERDASVMALVRDGSERAALDALGVDVVTGDAMSEDDVARAFDAHGEGGLVVTTMAGGSGSSGRVDDVGNMHVIDAATQRHAQRFVFVTSLGCGETREYMSEGVLEMIGDALSAKTIAEEHLRETELDWTIVRPGRLLDGDPTGNGALYDQADIHGAICREDVASLVLAAAAREDTSRRAYAALDMEMIRAATPADPTPVVTTHGRGTST
jgi:uncharacterized protein YbjT (DUF2867 family)